MGAGALESEVLAVLLCVELVSAPFDAASLEAWVLALSEADDVSAGGVVVSVNTGVSEVGYDDASGGGALTDESSYSILLLFPRVVT